MFLITSPQIGPPSLHRVDVRLVAGERNLALLADRLCRSLMIGMDVRQRQHRDLPAGELPPDPPGVPAPASVDQHVLCQ
jgi:hypothetical protein